MSDVNSAAVQAIEAETVASSAGAERAGEVTLSTGVVVRGRKIAREKMMRLYQRLRSGEPKVPIWHNPDKGRDEPNESDPDYIAAKAAWNQEFGLALLNVMRLWGLEVVSVPEGFPTWDSREWAEECAISGMSSGVSESARRYDWLTMCAIATDDDTTAALKAAGRANGTLEADVSEAVKSLRRDARGK